MTTEFQITDTGYRRYEDIIDIIEAYKEIIIHREQGPLDFISEEDGILVDLLENVPNIASLAGDIRRGQMRDTVTHNTDIIDITLEQLQLLEGMDYVEIIDPDQDLFEILDEVFGNIHFNQTSTERPRTYMTFSEYFAEAIRGLEPSHKDNVRSWGKNMKNFSRAHMLTSALKMVGYLEEPWGLKNTAFSVL